MVHLEDLSVDMGIISKWVFKKRNEKEWTGLIWLLKETASGLL
jgi:hypothetical protein